ncbi:MAG: iron-containing alcohol dehydrogenase [Synergistaceae bacterium]|nr:iron-containing alcohol dehydrogenase [Synergistaceae bacterium]
MNCRYYIPMLNLIGRGSVKEVGKEARNLHGNRAFIVASEGAVGEAQAKEISDILAKEGVISHPFCEAVPNPTVSVVEKGLASYQESESDIIVAVGGGSAIDTAKGIGLLATNGGNIRDYSGANKSRHAMPPFIAISTTAGTGSEVTQFAVISDDANHSKFTIVDWHTTPNVSVNDPEMMLSMPPSLTAGTGMDALTHAVEAYASKNATAVTDAKAYKAVELIAKSLLKAVKDGADIDARENMCYASFLAGAAFNNAGLGLTHALSHPLGGMYNLPHGLCNALLLPHVIKFNMDRASGRYSDLAVAVGAGKAWHSERENCESFTRFIINLSREIEIPGGLSEVGVKSKDLETLAAEAMEEAIGATNPRPYSAQQALDVYKAAF